MNISKIKIKINKLKVAIAKIIFNDNDSNYSWEYCEGCGKWFKHKK